MATFDDSSPFRCSICFNSKEGREPRALSCVHSFCHKCLKEWYEKRHREGHCTKTQIECPICRKKSALPSGDITSLPIDVNVQQFADYINKEIKSSICKLCKCRKGNSLCLNCSVLLCEQCSEKHKQSPLFRSHVFSRNICEVHGAVYQCLCCSCLCGVCLQCVHEDLHKNHSLVDTVSGIKDIKRKVEIFNGQLQELVTKGKLEVVEKRKYIKQIFRIEEKKETLKLIKREIERIENEIADHEKLCEVRLASVFEEFEAYSKQASGAILNVNQLLEEDEAGVLTRLKSAHVRNEEIYSQLQKSLSSIPDFKYVALNNSEAADIKKALTILTGCNIVFGFPDIGGISSKSKPLVKVLEQYCGSCHDRVMQRLCGTPEGDVIVYDLTGQHVYKLYKDGTTKGLHSNGRAACVYGGDVYVIRPDGGTVTQIKWDGSTVSHKITPLVSDPRGLAVSDDHVFILSGNNITKRPFFDTDGNETFSRKEDQQGFNSGEAGAVLSKRRDGGFTRMSNGHFLSVHFSSNTVAEYNMDGTFVKNILTEKNGIDGPLDVAYSYPYIWVSEMSHISDRKKTLKLFKFC